MKDLLVSLILIGCFTVGRSFKRQSYDWPPYPVGIFQSECNIFSGQDLSPFTTKYEQKNTFDETYNMYFTYMTFHKNDLYVSGMNRLFKFRNRNISDVENTKTLDLRSILGPTAHNGTFEDHQAYCRQFIDYKKWSPLCEIHVGFLYENKTLAKKFNRSEVLSVCTNGPQVPLSVAIDAASFEVLQYGKNDFPPHICSPYPYYNQTALYVENGNPDGVAAVYFAAYVEESYFMLGRTPLVKNSEVFLKEVKLYQPRRERLYEDPSFVGMFEDDEAVYTFFRNTKPMFKHTAKVNMSYVSRICKSDRGEPWKHAFLSYQVARLRCHLPYAEEVYEYDDIQAVQLVDGRFYGLFTSANRHDKPGTVLCIYSWADLKRVFATKEFVTVEGRYYQEDTLRNPPQDCNRMSNTDTASRERLNHTFYKYLKWDDIRPERHGYIFFLPNVFLQSLAVDLKPKKHPKFPIFYAGANYGDIFKIVWTTNDYFKCVVASVWKPVDGRQMPWKMLLHTDTGMLYVTYRTAIVQIDTNKADDCRTYHVADGCILNPLCSWNVAERSCVNSSDETKEGHLSYTSLEDLMHTDYRWTSYRLRRNKTEQARIWKNWLNLENIQPMLLNITMGETHTFDSSRTHFPLCKPPRLMWYHNGTEVTYAEGSNYWKNSNDALSLVRVAGNSGGYYRAIDDRNITVMSFQVMVHPAPSPEARWVEGFRDWARNYGNFKEKVKQWEKEQCSGEL